MVGPLTTAEGFSWDWGVCFKGINIPSRFAYFLYYFWRGKKDPKICDTGTNPFKKGEARSQDRDSPPRLHVKIDEEMLKNCQCPGPPALDQLSKVLWG